MNRLMERCREQERTIESLKTSARLLIEEQTEIKRLQKIIATRDETIDKKNHELVKFKTDYRNLETKSTQEKIALDQKIMDLETITTRLESSLKFEKTKKEQHEKELEKLCGATEENKMLTKQVLALKLEVEELRNYKNVATKEIEERKQQLKRNEVENSKIQSELNKMKLYEKRSKDLEEELKNYKDSLKSAMTEIERREDTIKQQAKTADALKETESCLRMKMTELTDKIDCQSVSIRTLKDQADRLEQAKKNATEESQRRKKESENQFLQIEKLEEQLKILENRVEEKDTQICRVTKGKEKHLVYLQKTVEELENRLRWHINQNEQSKADLDISNVNLSKAQEELHQKDKTIKDLNNRINDMGRKAEDEVTELAIVKNKLEKERENTGDK